MYLLGIIDWLPARVPQIPRIRVDQLIVHRGVDRRDGTRPMQASSNNLTTGIMQLQVQDAFETIRCSARSWSCSRQKRRCGVGDRLLPDEKRALSSRQRQYAPPACPGCHIRRTIQHDTTPSSRHGRVLASVRSCRIRMTSSPTKRCSRRGELPCKTPGVAGNVFQQCAMPAGIRQLVDGHHENFPPDAGIHTKHEPRYARCDQSH